MVITYNTADSDMQILSGFGKERCGCLNEAVSGGRV